MPQDHDPPLGGRLKYFLPFWKTICTDRRILNLIRGVKFEFDTPPHQDKLPRQIKMNKEEEKAMDDKIAELLANESICQIPAPLKDGFVSNAFLVKKKCKKSYRFIANLSKLNPFLKKSKFKMGGLTNALQLITQDCYMSSIDIESSFSLLALHPESQKFTTFQWRDKTYLFLCLCQGASVSPSCFVSVCRPLIRYLRKRNVNIFLFVDDSLILGKTTEILKRNVQMTIELFEKAGFLINYTKSQLLPVKIMEFLGFVINTVEFSVSLSADKRSKIYDLVNNTLTHPNIKITIRHLATIIGKIISTFPCSDEAPLHYRILDRFKVRCLRENKFKWNAKITLNRNCLQELEWWRRNISTDVMKRYLHRVEISAHVYSDSSKNSFGGWYNDSTLSSKFSEKQAELSINTKELLAIYYTLSAFRSQLTNLNILHFCDNRVAVYCISNLGSSDPLRDNITRKIYALAKENCFTLQATWLSTHANWKSDRLSRLKQCHRTEFCIPNDILYPAVSRLVSWVPEIDLFSSFLSHKYPLYCAWKNDPFALRCNAFLLDWSLYKVYIHCPFSIIDKALKQVEDQRVKHCLILAPLFHSAHWLPKLMEMTKQPPLLLPANTAKKLFIPWDSSLRHPLARHMRMILADICSSYYLKAKSQDGQLITLQNMGGELVQLTDMLLPRGVGSNTAQERKLTNSNWPYQKF